MSNSPRDLEGKSAYQRLVNQAALAGKGWLYPAARIRQLQSQGLAGSADTTADEVNTAADLIVAEDWCRRMSVDFRAAFAADVQNKIAELGGRAQIRAARTSGTSGLRSRLSNLLKRSHRA